LRREVATCAATAPAGTNIFVNVHATELGDEELYSASAALSTAADRVVLELTERASLHGIADLRDRIGRLRKPGYRIAVDNLGAGHAGLTSFSQLAPDIAKLDRSLIRGVDTSRRKANLVRSMISVCGNELGTRVVCEGVETTEERDTLE